MLREEAEGERFYELTHEYLITEIGTWIEPTDLEFKRAEELLQREMTNWSVHHLLIPRNRLAVLHTQRGRFTGVGSETWACLLRSAFVEDYQVTDWFKVASEDEDADVFKAITGLFISPTKEENRIVRRLAARTLGELKDARAVEPLVAMLQDEDKEVRQLAACARAEVRDPR